MPRFDAPLNTNDQSFDRVLNAGLPVALVISNGAGLNESLEETLRQVAKDDAGRLLVARLNASENPETVKRLNAGVPLLILFRDGHEVSRTSTLSSQAFREQVAYLLGRGPRPAQAQSNGGPQAHAKPVVVTDETFQNEVLGSDLPVLVDLWAAWCGPCRMIAPIVEKLAGEYSGRLKVAKLDVDENPGTAISYQVQGIPTLLFFRGGKLVDRIVGAAPEPMLRAKIESVLRG